MLSQKTRYALNALLALSQRGAHEPMLIADIANEALVSKKFLGQILLELKRFGIVYSSRGKRSGYMLGRSPDQIAFAEIVRAIDGPLGLDPCISATGYRRCNGCADEKFCPIRKVLLQVRHATDEILENYTLAVALSVRMEREKL